MEYGWNMFGLCGHAQNMYEYLGKCMTYAWNMNARRVEYAWNMNGVRVEYARTMIGLCIGYNGKTMSHV